jgi:hypothetical protein
MKQCLFPGVLHAWGLTTSADAGDFVVKPQYEPFFSRFSEGLTVVRKNEKYGFINKNDDFIIEPIFDSTYAFSEGLAAVKIENKYFYIDKTGTIVIGQGFDGCLSFSEGLAAVFIY